MITGVGVALPGALLPALIGRWHLGDAQGGFLFLMSFLGSSLGALLVTGSLRLRLILGSVTTGVAAAALGVSGGSYAAVWMGLYGAGLGMTMTAISLARQQQTTATGIEMVRLNLLWALGAFLCPPMTIHALRSGAVETVLLVLAGCFVAFGAWAFFQQQLLLLPTPKRSRDHARYGRPSGGMPWGLIVMIFLVTGIEASTGGWLATYAGREGHSIANTVAAPTFLWAGLLVSRIFWSATHRWGSEATTVRVSIGLMSGGAVLLLAGPSGGLTWLAAFLLGVGIGPTYPLLLAWALHFRRGGTIFFLAGLGSACLPWLTGVVSAWRGSLRIGLAVPAVGCLVMLILALLRPLHVWADV